MTTDNDETVASEPEVAEIQIDKTKLLFVFQRFLPSLVEQFGLCGLYSFMTAKSCSDDFESKNGLTTTNYMYIHIL
jgi:hypothetical protein